MIHRSRGRRAALLTTLVAGLLLTAAPIGAAAKDGDIIRTGNCSGATDWKLKLSPEDGGIEVEFEVDQNRDGQAWTVKLKKDGARFWRGQRVTRAPSGSFSVRQVTSNGAGSERIVGIATNRASGEVCRGSATFSA
jgi:catechol 2,3-dioxygenase-like lactoylglutathione lyase family enzyme